MELLVSVGMYALWFMLECLVYLFFAIVGGFGLAWGFKSFKDLVAWNKKRREEKQVKKQNKKYSKKVEEMDEEMTAAAAQAGVAG